MNRGVSGTGEADLQTKAFAVVFSFLMVTSVVTIGAVGAVGGHESPNGGCEKTIAAGNSIQEAIDRAEVGDTICLEGGTYNEGVLITTDGVSLVAEDPEEPPVLNGLSATENVAIEASNVEAVVVRDLKIEGWARGIQFGDVDNARIENLTVRDISNRGINLTATTDSVVRNNTLTDTQVGVSIREDSTGNLVENNRAERSSRYGFAVRYSSDNNLTANTANASEDDGIVLLGTSTNNRLIDNKALEGEADGFQIAGNENELRNNLAANNERDGIRVGDNPHGNENWLKNNTVADNGRDGIRLIDSTDSTLVENVVSDSSTHGIRIWNAPRSNVTGNIVTGSGEDGIALQEGDYNNVTENYVTDSARYGVRVGYEGRWNRDPSVSNSNSFMDNTVFNSGEWEYYSLEGSTQNEVTSLDIGASTSDNTTLSFEAEDVALRAVKSADVPAGPEGYESIGRYVEAKSTESGSTLDIEIIYELTDLNSVDDQSLEVWRHDGESWSSPAEESYTSSQSIDGGFVSATGVTQFSTFGVFGTEATGTLEGTVTNEETGDPISGVFVRVTDQESEDEWPHMVYGGNFEIGLPAGTYDVAFPGYGEMLQEYEPKTVTDITISPDKTTTIDVELTPVTGGDEATFTVDPETPTAGQEVTFDASESSFPGVSIIRYEWDFGDGESAESGTPLEPDAPLEPAEPITTHSYDEAGVYDVTLSIYGEGFDFYDDTTKSISVTAPEDDPGPSQPSSPDPAQFDVRIDNTSSPLLAGDTLYVMATVENTGESDDSQTVELLVDGTPVDSITVSLDVDQTESITLAWDTEEDDAGEHAIEVHTGDATASADVTVDGEVNVSVTSASVDPIELFSGESATVTATVTADGDAEGVGTISLEIDGTAVENRSVSVGPDEDTNVSFTHEFDAAGTYEVGVESVAAGTVNVTDGEPANIIVFGGGADREGVTPGETVTVTGDLYNSGDVPGEEIISLAADGNVVDETTVALERGIERDAVELSWTPSLDDFPSNEESTDLPLSLNLLTVDTILLDPAYSDIQVIAASTSDTETVQGEEMYVVGSIYQAGTIEGTEEIELTATHQETGKTEVLGSQEVSLASGFYHLGALNLTFELDDAGTYDLTLGDRDAGTVEVAEAYSDVQVIAASTSDVEIVEGETTSVVGSIYQAGNVEGTEEIELRATREDDDGEEVTEVVGSQEVTLAPGFYHLGAINVTWGPDPGYYDLQLGNANAGWVDVEPAESDVQVVAASASEVELIEGEEMHVVGSIYQAGNVEGTEEIELTATHQETNETSVVGSQEVSLAPGFYHLGALNVTFEPEDHGTYDLTLGDRDAGTVEVAAAYSDIQVVAASASEVELIEGEEMHVVGSIYQAGNVEGTEEIELTATHQETNETSVVGSHEVSLAPGFYHLGALNITFEPDDHGMYDLELGGTNAGTVEVEEAITDIQVIGASTSDVEINQTEQTHVVGSIYQAGNIEGTEEIQLTATHQETGETEVVGSQEVSLAPGFYHLGALNVTFEPDDHGTYHLELGGTNAGWVEVEEAQSDIQVIAASASDVEIIQGEEVYVVGSIYQAGNVDGTEEIELTATNQETNETEVVGSQEVSLAPGFYHLGALNVTFEPDEAGTYDLALGDRDAGIVAVEEAITDITVVAASVEDPELIQGEETYVVGSIYQGGNVAGTEEIELTATHEETGESNVIGSQEVSLAPGSYHLGALNVTFEPDDAGTYDLTLGDRDAGTVEVAGAYSDIQVIAASASEVELIEGEEMHVVGSIYQAGNVEGTEEIELTATHQETGETTVVGSQEATLSPGFYHLGALNITFEPDQAGTYDLGLGGTNAGTVEVAAAESDVQVIAASPSAVELIEGEEAHVVGSIYQNGTIDGPETIELTATHQETGETTMLGSQEVTLAPGFYHLGALNVTFELDQAGTYDLKLGDRDAGWVEVAAAESDVHVIAASPSDVDITLGEEIHVVGSVYQNGTIDGPETIELTATHQETGETEVIGSQEVSLAPGFYHLGALNVTFEPTLPGTYDLELGDRDAGWVEVEDIYADVSVIAASTSSVESAVGEEVYVVGSLHNAGNIPGVLDVELTANGEVVDSEPITVQAGTYHLGGANLTFVADEPGTYELTMDGRNAGTTTVLEPTVHPEVEDMHGTTREYDVEDEVYKVYASLDVPVNLSVDADHDIESVALTVDSVETTYTAQFTADHVGGDEWLATIDLDQIPDDGEYEVSVAAEDELGYQGTGVAADLLVVDREGPSMAAAIQDVDSEDAAIVVESDEPLSGPPVVNVEMPEGATQQVTMAEQSSTHFIGTLEFEESGEYAVSVEGTDLAGNVGSDDASVVVNTDFTIADGVIANEVTGTTIEFEAVEETQNAIEEELYLAISENTVNPHSNDGALGVDFLTAELDDFLAHHLEEATISLAVDDSTLPDGVSAQDAQLHHYDAEGGWNAVETTYDEADGSQFLRADVTHFSTYGAFVPDNEPPVVTNATPTNGSTLDADTDEVMLRFEYADDLSGVDVSSVSVAVDGTDVTGHSSTSITSAFAEHVLAVEKDGTHEATLTVADQAGNEKTQTVEFTIDNADKPSPVTRDPVEDSTGDELLNIWLLVALAVLLGGGVLGYRYRQSR